MEERLQATDASMRPFYVIWLGQLVSLIGTNLSGFAMGIWVYRQTGSITQFAWVTLFAMLPGIVFTPFAGALVDSADRRRLMMAANLAPAIALFGLAERFHAGHLATWQIYAALAVCSVAATLQGLVGSAVMTSLVPSQHLGRANGMFQGAQAVGQLVGPLLGGVLLAAIDLAGILVLDVLSYGFAVIGLLTIPAQKLTSPERPRSVASWAGAVEGWQFIVARAGLLGLMVFSCVINYALSLVQVLFSPLVLHFATVPELGRALSIGGCGMLLGSVVMSLWGGTKRRTDTIFGLAVWQGLCLCLGALRPSLLIVTVATFGYLFAMPLMISASMTIWQSKVPKEVQGRVFGVRMTFALASAPLAYVTAGPLADGVFGPAMAAGGWLAASVGNVVGVGPERGIAAMFLLLGLALMAVATTGFLHPRLRSMEQELPDYLV